MIRQPTVPFYEITAMPLLSVVALSANCPNCSATRILSRRGGGATLEVSESVAQMQEPLRRASKGEKRKYFYLEALCGVCAQPTLKTERQALIQEQQVLLTNIVQWLQELRSGKISELMMEIDRSLAEADSSEAWLRMYFPQHMKMLDDPLCKREPDFFLKRRRQAVIQVRRDIMRNGVPIPTGFTCDAEEHPFGPALDDLAARVDALKRSEPSPWRVVNTIDPWMGFLEAPRTREPQFLAHGAHGEPLYLLAERDPDTLVPTCLDKLSYPVRMMALFLYDAEAAKTLAGRVAAMIEAFPAPERLVKEEQEPLEPVKEACEMISHADAQAAIPYSAVTHHPAFPQRVSEAELNRLLRLAISGEPDIRHLQVRCEDGKLVLQGESGSGSEPRVFEWALTVRGVMRVSGDRLLELQNAHWNSSERPEPSARLISAFVNALIAGLLGVEPVGAEHLFPEKAIEFIGILIQVNLETLGLMETLAEGLRKIALADCMSWSAGALMTHEFMALINGLLDRMPWQLRIDNLTFAEGEISAAVGLSEMYRHRLEETRTPVRIPCKTELICLLDNSGSMNPLRHTVLQSFNNFLNDHIDSPQPRSSGPSDYRRHFISDGMKPDSIRFTSALFSDEVELLYEAASQQGQVQLRDYQPYGGTALYDAIGEIVTAQRERIRTEQWANRIIVCIVTDGEDNMSTLWDRNQVRQLILDSQSDGWVFMYMGANHHVFKTAAALGISSSHVMQFEMTPYGMEHVWLTMGTVIRGLRC